MHNFFSVSSAAREHRQKGALLWLTSSDLRPQEGRYMRSSMSSDAFQCRRQQLELVCSSSRQAGVDKSHEVTNGPTTDLTPCWHECPARFAVALRYGCHKVLILQLSIISPEGAAQAPQAWEQTLHREGDLSESLAVLRHIPRHNTLGVTVTRACESTCTGRHPCIAQS